LKPTLQPRLAHCQPPQLPSYIAPLRLSQNEQACYGAEVVPAMRLQSGKDTY